MKLLRRIISILLIFSIATSFLLFQFTQEEFTSLEKKTNRIHLSHQISIPFECEKKEITIPEPPSASLLPEIPLKTIKPFVPSKHKKQEVDEGEKWLFNLSSTDVFFEPLPFTCENHNQKKQSILQIYSMRKRLSKMKVVLIGQYFIPDSSEKFSSLRKLEFDTCLQTNLENPFISEIHLLQEEIWLKENFSSFINSQKLKIHHLGNRMKFSDAIEYANKNLIGSVVIIANSDIYFDNSLLNLVVQSEELDTKKIYVISRKRTIRKIFGQFVEWDNENDRDQCEYYNGSHDAFIFVPSLSEDLIEALPFYLGVPGIENRVIWEMKQRKMKVLNPCKVINVYHLHLKREPWKMSKRLDKGKVGASAPTDQL